MKQFIFAICLLALASCSPEPTPGLAGKWWHMVQWAPQPPTSRQITLNPDGTLAGGTWTMQNDTFVMIRYSVVYTGVLNGNRIEGTTVQPPGIFTMDRQ